MKAALYIRVSTTKQEADNQALQLREYCSNKGYDIVNEYVDVISGKETSRPAYDQLYKDAHKYYFEIVVFWDLSRFSRSGTLFTLQKLKELDNLKIGWESYQEPYLRSAGDFKDVVISVIASVAKIEREKISERTKAGLARARAAGKQLGRKKGQKDKKPRRRKGYYDNVNARGERTNKGGVTTFIKENHDINKQTNARLLECEKNVI